MPCLLPSLRVAASEFCNIVLVRKTRIMAMTEAEKVLPYVQSFRHCITM